MGNFYDLHRRIQGAYLVIVEKRRYRQEEYIDIERDIRYHD